MASIRTRVRKNGAPSFNVMWRDADLGKQTSMTFDDEGYAELVKRLLDANGQSFAKVETLLVDKRVTGPTVTEMIMRHIELYTRANGATKKRYRGYVENHINPRLGHLRAAQVEAHHISEWITWMQTEDEDTGREAKSAKTIANVHGVLSAAFDSAIFAEKPPLRPDNPCDRVRLPQVTHAEDKTTFLTQDEYELLEAQFDKRWRPFVRFLVSTGLRWSEATALDWGHLELTSKPSRAHVERAWKEHYDEVTDKRTLELGPPKTRRARRIVAVEPQLTEDLAELRGDAQLTDYVFTTPAGSPVRTGYFHTWVWSKALAKAQEAGLGKSPRPHDLRHTYASWLLDDGIKIQEVSRMMGHENIQVTWDTYGHLLPGAHKRAADAMEARFAPKPKLRAVS